MNFCFVIIAFLLPLHCWSFPVGGSNTDDVSTSGNHTTIGHEGDEQGNSVNISTTDFPAANVTGATSLTSTQKQNLMDQLSMAKYRVKDFMAAYCGLDFVQNNLTESPTSCEEFADDFDMHYLGDVPSNEEQDGLKVRLTHMSQQTMIMKDLLTSLLDLEFTYVQREYPGVCDGRTRKTIVSVFCNITRVLINAAVVKLEHLHLKIIRTFWDLEMTPPTIEAHSFPLPVNAKENTVRLVVLAGIREVQNRITWMHETLELC